MKKHDLKKRVRLIGLMAKVNCLALFYSAAAAARGRFGFLVHVPELPDDREGLFCVFFEHFWLARMGRLRRLAFKGGQANPAYDRYLKSYNRGLFLRAALNLAR